MVELNNQWLKFKDTEDQLKIIQISNISWALVEATPENNLPYRVKLNVLNEINYIPVESLEIGEDILNSIYSQK
jgi:hypothetical protein